ncbi:MAG: DegV family protein, partial [Ornithinibacter sp.]
MTTALVTDSTAYLPADLLEGLDVQVVPLHVVVGGREHSEGVDIDPGQVASALRDFTPVSTSRPAPTAFLDAYRRAADGGADSIVSVHISAEMSSTIGGAEIAAEQSPIPVTVVDSRALGMAMGYAVLAGARLAATGAGAQEVAELVRETCAGATVVFYVDTLEYLRRGGRIGKAGALLGSALSIKPILGLREGSIMPLEKVRTSTRAIARIEEIAAEAAGASSRGAGADVAVHHLDSVDRAERLASRLAARLGGGVDVRVVELGAVVGAHVGPGTLAVAVVAR